jgi:hypothetical protein
VVGVSEVLNLPSGMSWQEVAAVTLAHEIAERVCGETKDSAFKNALWLDIFRPRSSSSRSR